MLSVSVHGIRKSTVKAIIHSALFRYLCFESSIDRGALYLRTLLRDTLAVICPYSYCRGNIEGAIAFADHDVNPRRFKCDTGDRIILIVIMLRDQPHSTFMLQQACLESACI